MKRFSQFMTAFACITGMVAVVSAQDLEDYVSKYTSDNGAKFMQPLADAFGANLNSGFYQSARLRVSGLHIYLGVETMVAIIANSQKTFMAKTEAPFTPPQTVAAPTIFGSSAGAAITGSGGTVFNFPGGLDLDKLPLAVPQLRVGSFRGTEASLRFVEAKIDDNIGRVKLFGFGVRHSISQYLKNSPVDITVGFFIQKFKVGDLVDARSQYYGLQSSYTRGVLTFYGGFGLEAANLDMAYQYDSITGTQQIAFDLQATNSVRLTTGLALQLAVVHLHLDYNLATQNVVTGGLGFGF